MAREPDALMIAEHIGVEYRALDGVVPAVVDVSLLVPRGALLVLAGPSGSGKSSLLRVLGLLDRPTRGQLSIDGVDVGALSDRSRRRLRRRKLAYVHQRPVTNLVDDLVAGEQIAFARQVRGLPPCDAAEALDRFGLAHHVASRPVQLSGGEQQRLAIAMAVAGEPRVLLADEPTAELDRHHAAEVIDAIRRAAADGQTVVVASHDHDLIGKATHLVWLSEGHQVEHHG